MKKNKRKPGSGGKRAGAGRPAPVKKRYKTIYASDEALSVLEHAWGEKFSEKLNELLVNAASKCGAATQQSKRLIEHHHLTTVNTDTASASRTKASGSYSVSPNAR